MRSIVAMAACILTACAGSSGALPSGSILGPSGGTEADLYARYQHYRRGPPPHLDFETWKKMYGNPANSGNGAAP